MTIDPTIVKRDGQPYVGFRETITMNTFDMVTDRIPQIFTWLAEQGVTPAGPPFLRFDLIDMERELVVEAGVPVAGPPAVDPGMVSGVLPSGRYVSALHTGDPDELIEVTANVLSWAGARDLEWDAEDVPGGRHWGCRLLVQLTDPAQQPDRSRWQTELLFRLAD